MVVGASIGPVGPARLRPELILPLRRGMIRPKIKTKQIHPDRWRDWTAAERWHYLARKVVVASAPQYDFFAGGSGVAI